MGADISKPTPEGAMSAEGGTFLNNTIGGDESYAAGEEKNGFHIDTLGVIVSELYVNNSTVNVADKYILDPALPLVKFQMIIAKPKEQFTRVVWSLGQITAINTAD